MYVKKNTRVTFRSNRRQGHKRNNNFSNGKGRNKGNVTQQYQKYIRLAKEASSSGDRIQSEYYYQFADHYSRLMLELGITFDDNGISHDPVEVKSIEQNTNNNENSGKDNEITDSTKKEEVSNEDENNDHESIESVPFISQPVKKKSSKTKKEST